MAPNKPKPSLLTNALLSFLFLTSFVVAQGCSSSVACAVGCCSKFGFCGLGPDFCKREVCVNNCERKADCDPGGFGTEFVKKIKCPLNVCCSKHGFCGTTEQFCNGKKVRQPSCSAKDQSLGRVVGYYEGWSRNRMCNKFYPEQLPIGVYTHLNFAFASINPKTFEVIPASATDIDMYKRLTNLKKADPDLKVFIAIGGWTFNDPGATATTFSGIAGSEENTNKFARSLISFMSTYDFDGVDLDWEYPVAPDRGGRPDDFENFSTFMRRLKAALKASGGRDWISITLPASYWYLQHFDIEELQKHIDFFNIMSYDLHGTWDMDNRWVGSYLNAHTNLTELAEAMDLLWRNNVQADKVVLGLAFYGRAFTVSNPACTEPGCVYASGGNKRLCSNEVSVILNSEIDQVQGSAGTKAILNKDAAVKILNYEGNQWVAYDDEETLKMKTDFARKQCLGGVMVWAVSHDTKEAKYSMALAKAVNRKFVSADPATDDGMVEVRDKHAQCKWTNCGEDCPSGWLRILRGDGGARKGEYMVDEQGCNDLGIHQFCCPPGPELPTCGWYYHDNGKCKGGEKRCPSIMIEIGSNNMRCGHNYQVACCTVTPASMHLHNQCGWSDSFPNCDSSTCAGRPVSDTEFARSMTGSGGAFCSELGTRDMTGYPVLLPREERKYCCRNDLEDQKWSECEWYRDLGLVHQDWLKDKTYCLSGCPSDKVRVAMDYNAKECSKGARAKCCTPAYATVTKRSNPENQGFDDALAVFLDSPVCTTDTQNHRYESQETVISYMSKMLYRSVSSAVVTIWNNKIERKYPNLKYATVRSWAQTSDFALQYGSEKLPESIVCELEYFDKLIGHGDVMQCSALASDRHKKRSVQRRTCMSPAGYSGLGGFEFPQNYSNVSPRNLEKRDNPYEWGIYSPYARAFVSGIIWGLSYPSSGEWDVNEPIWHSILDFESNHCSNAVIGVISRIPGNNDGLHTEHVWERNSMTNFIQSTVSGILPGGSISMFLPINPVFWTATIFLSLPANIPTIGAGERAPVRRIMTRLGSNYYRHPFIMAGGVLNLAKALVWQYKSANDEVMTAMVQNTANPFDFLNHIRGVNGAILYLNHDISQAKLIAIVGGIRIELAYADDMHMSTYGVRIDAVARFDEWTAFHFLFMSMEAQRFIFKWLAVAWAIWTPLVNHPLHGMVTGSIQQLMAQAAALRVLTAEFPGQRSM